MFLFCCNSWYLSSQAIFHLPGLYLHFTVSMTLHVSLSSLHLGPTPTQVSAHSMAMAEILGGISLRSVPPPPVRPVGEERIVDVASELRQRVLKQKKQEVGG